MSLNKKISKSVGFSLVLICAILVGFLVFQSANISEVQLSDVIGSKEEAPSLDNSAECIEGSNTIKEKITEPFYIIDKYKAGGIATLSGKAATRTRETFGEEKIEKIFLKIPEQSGDDPAAKFYSHFLQMTERGNDVNVVEDNSLLFALGELRDKEFSSNADISPLAEKKIKDSLSNGENISLEVQVPVWLGSGAPSDFSFACSIKAAN